MNTLSEKIQQLGEIRAGGITYGPGDFEEQADRFYYDQLLPLVIQDFVSRSVPLREQLGPVDLQISMLGYSPETAILVCQALSPQRLILLHSAVAKETIGIVRRFVAGAGYGKAANLHLSAIPIPPTDPYGIVRIIRDAALETWRQNPSARIVVDITGGKKIMSAAAAIAAAQLRLPTIYIDSEYDPKLRRPTPGTEQLISIPPEKESQSNTLWNQAAALFNGGHFELAASAFRSIEQVCGAQQTRTWSAIAEFYAAWIGLDIPRLQESAKRIAALTTATSQRPKTYEFEESLGRLLRLTGHLASRDEEVRYLPALLFSVARFRRRANDFGLSALLYYRTIEACLQARLTYIAPGFLPASPDYTLMGQPDDKLLQRMRSIAGAVEGFRSPTALPTTVGLMNSVLLLLALADPLTSAADLAEPMRLGSLNDAASLRHESILGHGTRTMGASECDQLGTWAERIFEAYYQSMRDGVDGTDWDPTQLVQPPHIDLPLANGSFYA